MGGTQKGSKDLRIRNVSLHSRGKRQDGSLYLTKHHLIFSYIPDDTLKGEPRSSINSRATYGSNVSEKPREGASLDGDAYRGSSDLATRQELPKARPKEIWVPYPMINHCILRSSHSQTFRKYEHDNHSYDAENSAGDMEFPPVYGTSSYDRPSTDSTRLAPYASPQRTASPGSKTVEHVSDSGRVPAIRIRRWDFQMMAFHFHTRLSESTSDDAAREVFYCLRDRCCVDSVQNMHAFHFTPPQQELAAVGSSYEARREFVRMGIGGKATEGPGSVWRLSDINCDYNYSPTYPSLLCVPRSVSDNLLKYGGVFRSKARIPVLTYLHSNGGSITRSSQPLVGIQSKRNPQDERLVSAIFHSHAELQQHFDGPPVQSPTDDNTSSSTKEHGNLDKTKDSLGLTASQSDPALDEKYSAQDSLSRKRIYGSTRRNMIIDARPKVNALANRATGGGIEDAANYTGMAGTEVERVFLNIANIHAMRKSLDRVMESFANSDYLDMKPNQELLRNSGWLAHIANLLDGADMVARVVGLGGSHVLVHCSDGWDRTSQVAALSEIMLDPYYRTFQGFITLVQKDFISFGHKFNHRHGIQGSEKWFEIENERVAPSRAQDVSNTDTTGLNKAFSGAKNWFEKNRQTLFRQQNDSKGSLDDPGSRPPSPPLNTVVHSNPTPNVKDDKDHKTDIKEIAPIFHQFLDAVFQLLQHNPKAFEFNERFLRRLFYQAHSGQYGEFLFNDEKTRGEHAGSFCSVWPHFLSRKQEFTNPDFSPRVEDMLLFPTRRAPDQQVEVKWWSAFFQRNDEDMNNPTALAPPDPETNIRGLRLNEEPVENSEANGGTNSNTKMIREARSLPSIGLVEEGSTRDIAPSQIESNEAKTAAPEHKTSNSKALSKHVNQATDPPATDSVEISRSTLDFAAFAKQSAFSDR